MNLGLVLVSVLILAGITFLYRYSFISSYGKNLAKLIPQDFLRLLAPSTFAAIVTNNLVSQHTNWENFKIKGAVAVLALLVAFISKSTLLTLIFGLSLLYFLNSILVN